MHEFKISYWFKIESGLTIHFIYNYGRNRIKNLNRSIKIVCVGYIEPTKLDFNNYSKRCD